jgi:hypothetical protein
VDAGGGHRDAHLPVAQVRPEPELPQEAKIGVVEFKALQHHTSPVGVGNGETQSLLPGPLTSQGPEPRDPDSKPIAEGPGPRQSAPAFAQVLVKSDFRARLEPRDVEQLKAPPRRDPDVEVLTSQERIGEAALAHEAEGKFARKQRRQGVDLGAAQVAEACLTGDSGGLEYVARQDKPGSGIDGKSPGVVEHGADVGHAADHTAPQHARPVSVLIGPVLGVLGRRRASQQGLGQHRQSQGATDQLPHHYLRR